MEEIKKVSFNISGKNIMPLIRQMVDTEYRIAPAMDIIEDCGVPQEKIIDVILNKLKIEGDSKSNTLHLEEVNQTKENYNKWINNCCKLFAKLSTQITLIQERLYYYTLLIDYRGVGYRNDKATFTAINGNTRNKDLKELKKFAHQLGEIEPLISKIFPVLSIPITYLDSFLEEAYSDVEEEMEKIQELKEHPNFLPNINKYGRIEKYIPVKEFKTKKKYNYDTQFNEDVAVGSLDDVIEKPKKVEEPFEKIIPFGLDIDIVDTAWISPNGSFYGKFGMSYQLIHLELTEKLQDSGIIPKSEKNADLWLERNGWIKLSQGRLLASYEYKEEITKNQIRTLKTYAEIRKLERILIGMVGKTYPVNKLDELSMEHLIKS